MAVGRARCLQGALGGSAGRRVERQPGLYTNNAYKGPGAAPHGHMGPDMSLGYERLEQMDPNARHHCSLEGGPHLHCLLHNCHLLLHKEARCTEPSVADEDIHMAMILLVGVDGTPQRLVLRYVC